MTRHGVLLVAVFLLGGCQDTPQVLVQDVPTVAPSGATVSELTLGEVSEGVASPITDTTHAPSRPTPATSSATGTAVPIEYWWPDTDEEFYEGLNECGEPGSRWGPVECLFMGVLSGGTEGAYGVIFSEHDVDLLGAGWSMCQQMDRFPDPERFDEQVVPPDDWPPGPDLDFYWVYIAVVASQTLCDQHSDVGTWLMTPQIVEPSPSPS